MSFHITNSPCKMHLHYSCIVQQPVFAAWKKIPVSLIHSGMSFLRLMSDFRLFFRLIADFLLQVFSEQESATQNCTFFRIFWAPILRLSVKDSHTYIPVTFLSDKAKASELVPCSLLPRWNSMRFFATVSLYDSNSMDEVKFATL